MNHSPSNPATGGSPFGRDDQGANVSRLNALPQVPGPARLLPALVLLAHSSFALSYDVAEVVDAGALAGVVRLEGAPPPVDKTIIGKDNHVCGDGHAVMNPVRAAAGGGLADAVVVIEGIEAGKAWPAEHDSKIVQKDCMFAPYVQVSQKGTEMTVLNEDPLLHNIHAYELIGRARRTLFNIAQPQAGQIDTHALRMRRGDVVEVACDAHNWMSAYVYTADHPYLGVTADDGSFFIDGVPPGTYRVTVWHPTLGTRSSELTIAPGESTEAAFTLSADQA